MTAPGRPGRADGRLSAIGGGEIAGGELLRLSFRAMDTDIEALVEVPPGRRRDAERLLAWTRRWFVLLERRLSRFRPDSDVARMNRHAGAGPVRVGGLTAAILARALDLAAWSGGLFDPACQAAMEAAGYDRPYAELRGARAGERRAAPGPRKGVRPFLGSYRAVVLDRQDRTVQLPPGTGVDLGGIAKGWAADVAVRVLGTVGPALVNAGGDLAAGPGPRGTGGLWRVAVDGLPGRVLKVAWCGVATSGVDRRRWRGNGVVWHHLLDPRTGRPAIGGFRRVTAVAATAAEAEVAAKVVLILGPREAPAWVRRRPGLVVLAVPEGGDGDDLVLLAGGRDHGLPAPLGVHVPGAGGPRAAGRGIGARP